MRTLILLLLLTLPAGAATLRPFTTVERPIVRLSDLWDGVTKDRDLGPAPAPGARILVEAPQLAAIARQFDVDWEPASPGDRAIVERAGQPLSREAVLAAVRGALVAAGAPADADVAVSALSTPMVPTGSAPQPSISQLLYDAGTGEFTALVSVAAEGMAPTQSRVAGRLVPMQELPVPTRAISSGEVVGAADLHVTRVRAANLVGETVRSAGQAIGFAPRRPLAKGQPILLADLERPVLVRRGASVTMVLAMPGLALTAEGIGMGPAAMGERIRVLNPSSKMLVEAEVTGPGEVRVVPGAPPIPAGASAGWALAQGTAR